MSETLTSRPAAAAASQGLLRAALRANAGFSALSGLTMILAAGPLSDLLGITPAGSLRFLGANLLIFAAALVYVAAGRPISRRWAWIAIMLDDLWVVGSGILLLTDWVPLTSTGRWVIALLALIVAAFAGAQWYGLRRS